MNYETLASRSSDIKAYADASKFEETRFVKLHNAIIVSSEEASI